MGMDVGQGFLPRFTGSPPARRRCLSLGDVVRLANPFLKGALSLTAGTELAL